MHKATHHVDALIKADRVFLNLWQFQTQVEHHIHLRQRCANLSGKRERFDRHPGFGDDQIAQIILPRSKARQQIADDSDAFLKWLCRPFALVRRRARRRNRGFGLVKRGTRKFDGDVASGRIADRDGLTFPCDKPAGNHQFCGQPRGG